jgi:hypothetical protein
MTADTHHVGALAHVWWWHRRLAEFLHRPLPFDILLLQEVFFTPCVPARFCQQERVVQHFEQLGYHVVRSPAMPMWRRFWKRKWTDSGLLIISKFPVERTGVLLFNDGIGLDRGAEKGCLFARIRVSETHAVNVFNCHLQVYCLLKKLGVFLPSKPFFPAGDQAPHGNGEQQRRVRLKQLREMKDFLNRMVTDSDDPWLLSVRSSHCLVLF